MKKKCLKLGIVFLCVFSLLLFVTNKKNINPLYAVVDNPSPYGINTHNLPIGPGGYTAMDLAKQAGIKWMRIDLWWKAVEQQAGVFTWTDIDTIVNYAMNNGFSILANLASTPQFYGGGVQQGDLAAGRYLPAAYLLKWDTFISQVVNRYKNSIKYWEIWNEPNLNKFWDVRDTDGYSGGNCGGVAYNRNVGGYLQVLLVAAQRIKAVDPSAHVCAPGVTGLENISSTWNSWIKPILCMMGGFIDVFTHHQYNNDPFDVLAKLDQLRGLIVGYGYGAKPFWLTETGWSSSTEGECIQSINLQVIMDGMEQRSWWNKTFWYMLRDVGVSQEGIIKENNAVKYAWCAYKEEAINKASPDLYSPPNDTVLYTTTPTLEWKNYCPRGKGCPGLRQVDWYEIQIIEASTGQVVVYDDVNYHTGDIISYIVPSGELTNTRYKWRVRFCNEDTGRCCPWSQPWYFTISY